MTITIGMTSEPWHGLPEEVAAHTRRNCEVCLGSGWVCEEHPMKPWEGDFAPPIACDCGAPGMPCVCTGMQGEFDASNFNPHPHPVARSAKVVKDYFGPMYQYAFDDDKTNQRIDNAGWNQ